MRPSDLSIFTKILLSLVSTGLLIAITSGYAHYRFSADLIENSVRNQMRTALQASAAYFERTYVVPVSSDLRILESSPVIDNLLTSVGDDLYLFRPQAERLFSSIYRSQPSLYTSLRLVDAGAQERIIIADGRRIRNYGSLSAPSESKIGQARARLFSRLSRAQPRSVLFEGPFQTHNDELVVLAGITKIDPDIDGFGGAIIAVFSISDYLIYLTNFEVLGRSMFWLFDQQGKLLLQPNPAHDALDPRSQLFDQAPIPEGAIVITSESFDDNIAFQTFRFAMSLSPSEFSSQLDGAVLITLLVSLAMFLLAFGIALTVAKQFSSPVRALSKLTGAISAGNLRTHISEDWGGEMGSLAAAFNRMVVKLRESTVSRRYVDDVFDSMPEALLVLSNDGTVTKANRTILRLCGYDEQELLGKNVALLFADPALTKRISAAPGEISTVSGLETTLLSKFGSRIPVLLTASILESDNNEERGMVCVLQDITYRKRAEETITRFGRILEESLNEIYIFDAETLRFVQVNRGARQNTGYSMEELENLTPLDLKAEFTRKDFLELLAPLRIGVKTQIKFTTQHTRKDGSLYPVDVHLQFSVLDGKNVFVAIIQDITERQKAEEALRRSEKRFRALYDDNPSMFFTLDESGKILSVNRFGAEQLGYAVEQLEGQSISALHPKTEWKTVEKCLAQCFADPSVVHRWEIYKSRKDGSLLWGRDTARVVDDDNDAKKLLIVCEDITEAHELSKKLSYFASHDSLTGLVNRREFEIRLGDAIEKAQQERVQHVLCYLDLDQFKVINDTCGHIAGDTLLKQLAELLRNHVRKRDTLARLGGDEFGILLEQCTAQQAKRVANAVLRAIEHLHFVWENKSFGIGASIGLVPIFGHGQNINSILSAADAACYSAKDEGRNRIHVYREDDVDLVKRHGEMQWVVRINRALEENRFSLVYQKIIPIKSAAEPREHYELLLRLDDEDTGVVLPGTFLGAAERYGLSSKLDRWVVSTAFDWLSASPDRYDNLSLCAINLSGQSLADDSFREFIIQMFSDTRVPPEKICFEITETAAISNLSNATNFINSLRQLHCKFALDDFGSGLSSFAYLKTLPVDYVKIDGLFVKDIADDPIDRAMVKSINDIGQVMGKKTVAEFVESEAIFRALQEIGVDYAQGYWIGKPAPLRDLDVIRAA